VIGLIAAALTEIPWRPKRNAESLPEGLGPKPKPKPKRASQSAPELKPEVKEASSLNAAQLKSVPGSRTPF